MKICDLEDDVFLALCQIEYLRDGIEEGGRIEKVKDDAVTFINADGSESTFYLQPVQDLLDALRKMT